MSAKKMKNEKRAIAGLTLSALVMSFPGFTGAQTIDPAQVRSAASASRLKSLATVGTPKVSGLNKLLKTGAAAKRAAIQLGKAFFWDMQAGSDGQACGSCHFHAGADNRNRNQLSPGLKNVNPALQGVFNPTASRNIAPSGVPGGPDYTLVAADFPFHQLTDPNNKNFNTRTVTFDTDDVASSMGVFNATFTGIGATLLDTGVANQDSIFNLDYPSATFTANNVRRVEPRNTPTMINAVFNHSNFWDGRAHNLFNGMSPIGPLDTSAMIWVNNGRPGAAPVQVAVRIPNSSLASQAVGPPTSNMEMSFFDRPFPHIGRKLLNSGLTPLGEQLVDPTDSVLGPLSNSPLNGLNTTYTALIQAAFQDEYWNGANVTLDLPGTAFDGSYTQMEANFTLFWGLAIQMYETTLVSDQAPFDAFMEGDDAALTQQQLQGLLVFLNRGADIPAPVKNAIAAAGVAIGQGNCVACHSGPEFTGAAFSSLGKGVGNLELIEIETSACLGDGTVCQQVGGNLLTANPTLALEDNGFANIGVRPTNDDLGRGADGDFSFPLSFARQALAGLTNLLPAGAELPCTLGPAGTCPPGTFVQADGLFKIPGLRNVELTGPYFHNGGQATLTQVIQFYTRQGDFGDVNLPNTAGEMTSITLTADDIAPLVAFLLSLTDERVRYEQAPFDHPEIRVPNGGTFGDAASIATDPNLFTVPAVGAAGRAGALGPLGTFLGLAP